MFDEPTYEARYCAFVDVLGFRELISKLKSGSISYQDIREALVDFHNSDPRAPGFGAGELRITSMSDAICVSAVLSEEGLLYIVNVLGELTSRLLKRGYLVRGALVKGMLYHDDRTVFGEALVRAYELEQSTVRYPRIMISSDVLTDIQTQIETHPGSSLSNCYLQDDDGPWYLHVLKHMSHFHVSAISDEEKQDRKKRYNEIATLIQQRFNEATDNPRHFEKVRWFAKYWNQHAFECGIQCIMRIAPGGQTRVRVW